MDVLALHLLLKPLKEVFLAEGRIQFRCSSSLCISTPGASVDTGHDAGMRFGVKR